MSHYHCIRDHIAGAISEAMEIKDGYKGVPFVEITLADECFSIRAHGNTIERELVVYNAGKTILTETPRDKNQPTICSELSGEDSFRAFRKAAYVVIGNMRSGTYTMIQPEVPLPKQNTIAAKLRLKRIATAVLSHFSALAL